MIVLFCFKTEYCLVIKRIKPNEYISIYLLILFAGFDCNVVKAAQLILDVPHGIYTAMLAPIGIMGTSLMGTL